MKVSIISKEQNILMKRKEIKFNVDHSQNGSTPSRVNVRIQLASLLKIKPELIFVKNFKTKKGTQFAVGEANIYDSIKVAEDMVFVGSSMYEIGVDGYNIDTTASFGDVDFLASLRTAEILKKKYPDICIEMGMASEFVLGIHGELTYDGVRLAGLYPHQQLKLAEKAGVTIFGPVVNVNTRMSCVENMARALTFVKPCVENSRIPIHCNIGMGVGGTPLIPVTPLDTVSRGSTALVEIGKVDGL